MYSYVNFAHGTTFALNLYCFALYCFLLLISLKGNIIGLYARENNRTRTILLFCGIILFSMTAFIDEDFFHYHELMAEYRGSIIDDEDVGIETVYQYLISRSNGNYAIFRFAVWGCSAVMVVVAARLLGVSVYRTLFVVLAGFIMIFSYARATLAMSLFSIGVVAVCNASGEFRKKRLLVLIGIGILVCSVYFHRSMLPVIALALCWLVLPWKSCISRYSMWLLPVFIVLFAVIIRYGFGELSMLANSWNDDETGTLDKMEHYRTMKGVSSNLKGYITLLFKYSTFYIPFAIIANNFRKKEVAEMVGNRGVWLYLMVYLMLVFATSLLFLGIDSSVLYYRYLFMTFIPLSLLIVYMLQVGVLITTQYFWIIACFIINILLQFVGAIYNKF